MLPILFLVYEEYKTFAVDKAYLKLKPLVYVISIRLFKCFNDVANHMNFYLNSI